MFAKVCSPVGLEDWKTACHWAVCGWGVVAWDWPFDKEIREVTCLFNFSSEQTVWYAGFGWNLNNILYCVPSNLAFPILLCLSEVDMVAIPCYITEGATLVRNKSNCCVVEAIGSGGTFGVWAEEKADSQALIWKRSAINYLMNPYEGNSD